MTPEQVVRDFMRTFETQGVEAAIPFLADDVKLSIVNPPLQGGKNEFIGQGMLIKEAMPDYQWGLQELTANGDEVTVTTNWSGTQTGTFRLSNLQAGAPDIPPTGKRVVVPDKFIFTVRGDKITGFKIDSPPGGGQAGLLQQLGVQLPPPPQ